MDLASVEALTNFKTEKQLQILSTIYSILYGGEKHTLSSLNRRVQKKTSISEPTIRRVLEKLRESNFIVAGSKGNENIKVSFNRGYSIMAMYLAPVSSNASAARKSNREMGIRFCDEQAYRAFLFAEKIPLTPLNLNKNRVSDNYG